jgi:diacylglycerol kinase (ATP)
MKSGKYSADSRKASFKYAFRGISTLFREEPNAAIHLAAALIVFCLGIFLKISLTEWCIIVIVAGVVFVAEIFNTSIETIGDIIDSEWNEKIMKAKDLAAAGVLVSAFVSVMAGLIIFVPKIISLFRT